jgi:membrane-associated protein
VAGIVKMKRTKFSFYNILGSFLWAGSIVSAGYLLGENEWAKENLEKIIIGIVLVTTGPVLIKLLMGRKKNKLQTAPVYNIPQKESTQETTRQ